MKGELDWGHDGGRFTLVTPLRAANGPDVLINRGWVPAEWAQDEQLRNQGEPSGKVCSACCFPFILCLHPSPCCNRPSKPLFSTERPPPPFPPHPSGP